MSVQAAPNFPALSGRVVDEANILSATSERQLTQMLARHEQATSNQVVVATLASLQGYDIADFGYQLGRHWGIGQQGRDNGVLLIVAPNEKKVRIEVGYGLEGSLTDALSKNIIESEITPRFKQGDMEGGILAGTRAILGTIEGSYRPERSDRRGAAVNEEIFNFFGTAVFISFIFAGVVRRMIGNRLLASLVMGGIAWLIGTLIFSMALGLFSGLAVLLVTLLTGLGGGGRGGGGYYGGYYGGGYSSGGGFGGFSGGGGGFGGGGASGGW
ncbi:MAG: TPM domain-containing protein [Pseudomonadota bacterium]